MTARILTFPAHRARPPGRSGPSYTENLHLLFTPIGIEAYMRSQRLNMPPRTFVALPPQPKLPQLPYHPPSG